MLADFILNLAAGFTQTLLTALAARLRGDPRRPALERAYKAGFARWLETLRQELSEAEIGVVGDAFRPLLAEADVANALLDLALSGDLPDVAWLGRRFGMVGGSARLVNIRFDFARQMTALQRCLIACLAAEASVSESPLFNQTALARLLAMHALLEDERRTLGSHLCPS